MSALSANLTIMLRAAEKASKSLLRDFGEVEHLQVSRKGPANFVSAADKRAEEIIFTELRKARPSYGFLMEESGEIKAPQSTQSPQSGAQDEFRFIVDPLDGTTNFLHGIPHFNISIGLERVLHDGTREIIAGLVLDPIKNEVFHAEKGTGAFLDKRRLRVSTRKDLDVALIAGGDCQRQSAQIKENFIKQYCALVSKTSGFRRMGAAALDLCYVAAGRFEAFWEVGLQPWDSAAGVLIVKEAGGTVAALSGDKNPVYAEMILASNALLHQTIRTILEDAVK